MGYLFLLLSVISGAVKGFFAKKVSDKTSGIKGSVFSNFIRMLFCIPIGLLFVLFDGALPSLAVSGTVLLISALAGVSTSIFIVFWLLSVKTSAYTSVDTFISLGIVIPILLSYLFYDEAVALSQIIGLLFLFGAVVIMSMYNNQVKQKMTANSLFLLIIVGISNGFTDFAYKIFQYNKADTPVSVFNFYIYVFSALTLLLVYAFLHFKAVLASRVEPSCKSREAEQTQEDAPLFDKRKTVYIFIMAVFLFCNSYFKTLATARLPAVQVYPLAQGAAIVLALLMSGVFFKEKIKPLCIVGLITLFISLLFINVIVF